MINLVILVALGGAVGAILREFLMLTVGIARDGLPIDIIVANVGASFLLGLASSAHARRVLSDHVHVLVGRGVMGGLSTFSSLVLGAVQLAQRGEWGVAIASLLICLVLGYLAVLAGLRLGACGGMAPEDGSPRGG